MSHRHMLMLVLQLTCKDNFIHVIRYVCFLMIDMDHMVLKGYSLWNIAEVLPNLTRTSTSMSPF